MKRRLKIITTVLAIFAVGICPALAQTVHQVSAGDGTIQDALDLAADGDILELVDDGGLYTNSASDKIGISKIITIRAKAGLETKPVVKNTKPSATSARTFEIRAGGSLILIGLDLDGTAIGDMVADNKNIVRSLDFNVPTVPDSFHYFLKIDDCILHNTTQSIVRLHEGSTADSVIITNSIFDRAGREAILTVPSTSTPDAADVKLMDISNCTFTRIEREALKMAEFDPVVKFNHCTLDSVSNSDYRMIDVRSGTAEVKNSIFTHGVHAEAVQLLGAASTISYIDTFMVGDLDCPTIGAGILGVDPLYNDPANGDYSLQAGSPVIGMADDGYSLGDMRWDPLTKVIKVEEGDGTIQDALDIAEDGNIIELVTSGGLYTNSGSDKIGISKVVTIRAREGLAQKPVVKNTKPSATSARIFEIRAGGSLTLIGLDLDGTAIGDMVADNKNIVRSLDFNVPTVPDSFHYYLKIDDCILHNTTQSIVRLHEGSTADSVIITNSIFDNAGREAILTVPSTSTPDAADVKLMDISNCTFTHIEREALKMAEFDPVVKFNHCTLDSVSNSDYRMIDVRSGTAEVKNSIFTHGIHAEAVQLLGAASTISYIDTFMVGDLDVPTIGTGILGVDPLYNDPANGDYRLAAASPVRGAADDGSAMGDLRWEALPSQYYLTIITEGNGIVELDPPGGVYDASTVVTLTAVPDPFWGLESWTGNVSPALPPDANPVTVTMNANETVTATFVNLKPKYLLSIDVVGVGHVEKSPEPLEGGVYEEGTEVTLEAVSDSITWAFTGWSGDTVSTVNPITVTVDSAISITASFASTLTQCTLSVDIAGMGEVDFDPEPLLGSYDTNTVVILTATAALGYEFSSWSGDFVSTENPDTFAVDSNMVVTATFNEVSVTSGIMAVDDSWDLRDALEFANNHSVVDTLLLTTSGGLYTSTNTSDVKVTAPLVIMAADTLAEKPICTNSDVEGSNDDIFRVFDDFTLIGVVLDGGHDQTHGPKYGIRLRDYSDREVKHGTDVTVLDCDFIDFFEDKVLTKDGHGFKIDVNIVAGGVKFENCTFTNFGYEAIRVSDTEKWVTERALDSLIVRNCTFTNIDAEGIRYYSDVDPATADPPVIAEHLTFNNSATRTIYIKNSGGAIVRDIIIANSRISGHGRDADLLDGQGNTGVPSYVSHIDTFNVLAVPIKSTDGEVDTTTIFGFDPMFEDAANLNYTLLSGSPAYGKAHDGEALGDLRWATNPPPAAVDDNLIVPAEYSLSQNYPNPFNPSTTIRFALKHPGKTTLVVYDLLGREILRLIDGEMEVGYHEVVLSERTIASGIYIYQLRSGEFVMAKKMILLK